MLMLLALRTAEPEVTRFSVNDTLKTGHHKVTRSLWGGLSFNNWSKFFCLHCSIFHICLKSTNPASHPTHPGEQATCDSSADNAGRDGSLQTSFISFQGRNKMLTGCGVRWGSKSELSMGSNEKKIGQDTQKTQDTVESTKQSLGRYINKRQVGLMRPGSANHSGGKDSKDRKCDLRQMRKGLQNRKQESQMRNLRNKTYKLTRWLWIPWQHQKPLFWRPLWCYNSFKNTNSGRMILSYIRLDRKGKVPHETVTSLWPDMRPPALKQHNIQHL